MQVNTFVSTAEDLLVCQRTENIHEVLIEAEPLSRFGKLSIAEAVDLAKKARSLSLRAVLVWDILMTDKVFSQCADIIYEIPIKAFSAIRVADLGALNWLIDNFQSIPLQLILEGSNHNIRAIQHWSTYIQKRTKNLPDRVVLSTQLPKEKICSYSKRLEIPLEILGAGPVILSYSPRPLLSPHFPDSENSTFEIQASSMEQGDLPCQAFETKHGSFFVLDRHLYVLDHAEALQDSGLHTIRIDLRQLGRKASSADNVQPFAELINGQTLSKQICWPFPNAPLFFSGNNTTEEFSSLKSSLVAKRDHSCIGKVVAAEKGLFTAIFTCQPVKFDQPLKIILTTGEEIPFDHIKFRRSNGDPLEEASADQLIFTSWLRKVTHGALLCENTVNH